GGLFAPDGLELRGGRRQTAQGRGHEAGPVRWAAPLPPGSRGSGALGAAPADAPRPRPSPPCSPLRSIPRRRVPDDRGGGVRRRAAGGEVRRRRSRVRPRLLRAEGLRAPGVDQAAGGADGAAGVLVGGRDRHPPVFPRRRRLADLRPGPRPGTPFAAIASARSTFRLVLSYDGTDYHGWQVQTGARTVQGTLIEAARARFGSDTRVTGASRTDAGVHALRQV